MEETFEVPLMLFLKANPHTIYLDRTVIIRPEWGISIHINAAKICDGHYIDKENEKIIVKDSSVSGYDSNGKLCQGSIMDATILMPIKILKK